MTMPLYAWGAYVHKAAAIRNGDTLQMAVATSIPHMEKADRSSVIRQLEEPLLQVDEVLSKEEYVAQMSMLGIETELN